MPKVTRDSCFQINQRISTEGREYQGVAVRRDRQVCQKGVIKKREWDRTMLEPLSNLLEVQQPSSPMSLEAGASLLPKGPS